ncbi:MAG: fibronectin type III domain-containing protein [Acidobacteriota bacterium]
MSFRAFGPLAKPTVHALVAIVTLAALLASSPVAATTYVMTTDDELLDRAGVVVVARVTASEASPLTGKPRTDYTIEIERLVKGFVPAGTLIVRTLGGVRRSGEAMRVYGMPTFTPGERVLLFLAARTDGTYDLVEMGLGAFQELTLPGRSLAVRSLGASHTVARPGDTRAAERRQAHEPRDLDKFADWLSDRASGIVRPADYFAELPPGGLVTKDSAFAVTMSDPFCTPALPLRWPEFDLGQSVRHRINQSGQSGIQGGGFDQIADALRAWDADSRSNVELILGQTTTVDSVETADGINPFVFEDPSNEIQGSFTATGGGTIAINLVFFDCSISHRFANGRAQSILETGTVTQDGTGQNFFARSATPLLAFAEVMAHETGHSLGLAHACGEAGTPPCTGAVGNALMNPFAHDDGRGASLSSDDRAGIRFLYPLPTTTVTPPDAPSALTVLATTTTSILLEWADNSSNETGFELQEADLESEFQTIQTLAADTTSATITGLSERTFRRYRVRAVNNDGVSDFSNEVEATTDTTPSSCNDDPNTLCISGRFEVTTDFQTAPFNTGVGDAVPLTSDTGYFTFFDPNNVEVVVKVLDGCPITNTFWVFAGGLTDVQVAMQVTDTSTGEVKTYLNPLGTPFAPIQDTSAFATCP